MSNPLKVGDKAPEFSLESGAGDTVKLKDLKGQPVILYFYPKDDTSGCTKEACDFRDTQPAIKKAGAVVLGVSPDSVASHVKFAKKYELPFTLLSDPDHAVAEKYGVWVEKSMYGRKYMGIERTTFLIDANGRIAEIWKKVKVPGHVDAVLTAVKGSPAN
ncbi:MAG TPA: thioredoxin-dependent thiol peroxidase [Caulifigura sp.]|nr:thioredoxin-dependent thiol peroxidase [Caulifigura sp.]